jgi:hypothetical protein
MAVLYLIPSPVFRNAWRVYSKRLKQRNEGRPWSLGYRGFGEEVDAVFLPEIAEPTEVSCCTLQGRRSPIVCHVDEAHMFEHQKLYIAGRPGKLPSQDGSDGACFANERKMSHCWGGIGAPMWLSPALS